MPTITAIASSDDDAEGRIEGSTHKNSQVRSVRRATRRDSQRRESARSHRGRDCHLSVRGELREQPDVRKIARAVIQLAMAQAEAEAQAVRAEEPSATKEPGDV